LRNESGQVAFDLFLDGFERKRGFLKAMVCFWSSSTPDMPRSLAGSKTVRMTRRISPAAARRCSRTALRMAAGFAMTWREEAGAGSPGGSA
jgi:hypothetical protein